jgi:hypothetical protein
LTDSRTHTARADGYVEDPKIRRIEDKRNFAGWRRCASRTREARGGGRKPQLRIFGSSDLSTRAVGTFSATVN